MSHVYSAPFSEVAVSVVQDLFELLAAAGVPFKVHSIRIGQGSDAGDAQAEMLPILISRTDGTTSGSGGTVLTPRAHSPATGVSIAASTTVEANNTIQATVATPIIADDFNVQAGWLYLPTPEEQIIVEAGGTLVVELPKAPADPIDMSGTITFEEIK